MLQLAAEQAITAARTPEAVPAQEGSASALGAAAEALDRLDGQLAHAGDWGEADQMARSESEQLDHLAQGAQAAAEAAQTREAPTASRAAQHLAQAAALAEARARQLGLRPAPGSMQMAGLPGYPLPYGDPRGRRSPDMRKPVPPDLDAMGIAPDDWVRLPGQLRSDILQAAAEDAPEEYRLLIKRYFRALARQGAAPRPGKAE